MAGDLGYLPLALAQAAAYMADLRLDCAAYRRRLADRRRRMADMFPDDSGLPDDQWSTLAAVWSLSVEQAGRMRPAGLAGPMLELASMGDPNGIPVTVLSSEAALAYLAGRLAGDQTNGSGEGPSVARSLDADDARDAMACLHRFSLAEFDPGSADRAVRVHNLIQRVTRENLTPDRLGTLARAFADALLAAWPEVERDTRLAQALRSSTDLLVDLAGVELWRPRDHAVMSRAGRSLGTAGLAVQAAAYFEDLHAAASQYLGPDHLGALVARHNLAYWRGKAGDPAGAAAALEDLLADQLRVLGPDDPGTLATRHNIADWRGKAGDAVGAAGALEELLSEVSRVFGPDHPDTLTSRANLADFWGEAGDPARAASALEDLLPERIRVLGPDHPATMTTRHNLANWCGKAGDQARAAAAMEDVLADQLRVLGPDHPDTLTTRHNIAHWSEKAGDSARAAAALEQVLADQLRVLGPDHPDTLMTRHNAACMQADPGDPAGAVAELKAVLAARTRVLGTDHPNTSATRAVLDYWIRKAANRHR